MAATKAQGKAFTLFIGGLTAATAGVAYFSSGGGKAALALGLICVAVSLWNFLKIKPLEGKVALGSQPALLKLAGVGVVLLGWLSVLFGIHLSTSVTSRMGTTIVGFAISLAGVLFILPLAANKNAIWKR